MVLLLLIFQADLIDGLRADSIEVRENAQRELKRRGSAALPALEKAAADPDRELAARARRLVLVIRIQARLPAATLKAWPGIEERLADHEDTACLQALDDLTLQREDLSAEAVEPLLRPAIRAAKSEDERRRVAAAMERFGLDSAASELLRWFDDPRLAGHGAAADALIHLDARDAAPLLLRFVDSPRQPLRFNTARLLGELGSAEQVPALVKLLKDESPPVRIRAVEALGRMGARTGTGPLIACLSDPSFTGIENALARIGDPDAIPALRRRLQTNPAEAAPALASLGAEKAVQDLLDVFSRSRPDERRDILFALVRLQGPAAAPLLVRELEGPGRRWAIKGLAEIRDMESVPRIATLLGDPDEWIRTTALHALGELGARDRIPVVALRLNDPVPTVRSAACRALGRLKAGERIDVLATRLKDLDPLVRGAAAEALSRLGGRREAAAIAPLLDDIDVQTRVEAVRAIVTLEGAQAAPRLVPLLSDPSAHVRLTAADQLCRLGSREAVDYLLREGRDRRWGIRSGGSVLYIGKPVRVLNAVFAPELWKSIESAPAPDVLSGTRRERVDALARAAGLETVWPLDLDDPWFAATPPRSTYRPTRVLDALDGLLQGLYVGNITSRYEIVLEPGRLRILRSLDAIRHWERLARGPVLDPGKPRR